MNPKNLGIVIQARLGSTRLPRKILKALNSRDTILSYLISNLSQLNLPIIVATTESPNDNDLVEYLTEQPVHIVRGSENNVLERFIFAAKKHELGGIIRICSDSPFLELEYLKDLILQWSKSEDDLSYLSYSYHKKPTVLSHFGIFAEIVSVESLEDLDFRFPENEKYKEHVTLGIYSNTDLYKVRLIPVDENFERFDGVRMTIDTLDDYENVLQIMKRFEIPNMYKFEELANWAMKNSIIFNRMKNNVLKNEK